MGDVECNLVHVWVSVAKCVCVWAAVSVCMLKPNPKQAAAAEAKQAPLAENSCASKAPSYLVNYVWWK